MPQAVSLQITRVGKSYVLTERLTCVSTGVRRLRNQSTCIRMMRRCVDFLVDAVPTQLASRGGVVSPVQPKAHNANFFQTGQQDIREDTGNEILDLPTERTFTNDERGYANIADFSFLPTELQIATDAGPGDCSSSSSSLYTSDGGIQIAMCFLVGCGGVGGDTYRNDDGQY